MFKITRRTDIDPPFELTWMGEQVELSYEESELEKMVTILSAPNGAGWITYDRDLIKDPFEVFAPGGIWKSSHHTRGAALRGLYHLRLRLEGGFR